MQEEQLSPCPKCGERFIPTQLANEGGRGFTSPRPIVRPRKRPLFSVAKSYLQTLTCSNCGYTEIYASEPGKLKSNL